MKKSVHFLFTPTILLMGLNSFAGSTMPIANKPAEPAPIVRPSKTESTLIIFVLDDQMMPIQGASVYAPCTGFKPVLTDVNGEVQFNVGTCKCDGAMAQITTPAGCNDQIKLSCIGPNNSYCDK